MLDKYYVQIDRDLLLRFVEAVERIAPPKDARSSHEPSSEDDVVDIPDGEYARRALQWQLDDLVASLTGDEANSDEIAKLTELKAKLADPEWESEREREDAEWG